ncbi:MAG: anti-sigma factor antagonist [Planctomycetota bacterium]|nr:anti-sigma factor antagonist [Planctomycetota bacterium]
MASTADMLFGKLAVMNRFATREQVDACIAEQESLARSGSVVPLGEVMLKRNALTADQVDSLLMTQSYLEVRRDDVRFGELAIKNGLANEAQVSECLSFQEKHFQDSKDIFRIGELMQERGYLTPQQVTAILKAQERLKAAVAAQKQRDRDASGQPQRETDVGQPGGSLRDGFTASPAVGGVKKTKSEPVLPTAPVATPPQKRPSEPRLPAVHAPGAAAPRKTPSDPRIPTVTPVAPVAPKRTPSDPRLASLGRGHEPTSKDPWIDATTGSEPALVEKGLKATIRIVQFEGTGTAKHKQIVVVYIEGMLDAHTFPYFEQYMNDLADAGHNNFVVNCEKLDYISSPGIGVLIGMVKRTKETKGDLRLTDVPAKIKQIIDLLGPGLIRVFEMERGAIMSFRYV